jgi:hypothetical protein
MSWQKGIFVRELNPGSTAVSNLTDWVIPVSKRGVKSIIKLFIYLFILYIRVFTIYLFVCLSVHLYFSVHWLFIIYLCIYLFNCLCVRLFVCSFACLLSCSSFYLFLYFLFISPVHLVMDAPIQDVVRL